MNGPQMIVDDAGRPTFAVIPWSESNASPHSRRTPRTPQRATAQERRRRFPLGFSTACSPGSIRSPSSGAIGG